MPFIMPPKSLAMVDCSKATSDDLLQVPVTGGQLILRLCTHPEGLGQKFCLDDTSRHRSINEILDRHSSSGYFPHISLDGLPGIGDRPVIVIYHDQYWREHKYHLQTAIQDILPSKLSELVHK